MIYTNGSCSLSPGFHAHRAGYGLFEGVVQPPEAAGYAAAADQDLPLRVPAHTRSSSDSRPSSIGHYPVRCCSQRGPEGAGVWL